MKRAASISPPIHASPMIAIKPGRANFFKSAGVIWNDFFGLLIYPFADHCGAEMIFECVGKFIQPIMKVPAQVHALVVGKPQWDRIIFIAPDQDRKNPLFVLFGEADLPPHPFGIVGIGERRTMTPAAARMERSISLSQAGEPGIRFSISTHTLMPRPRNSAMILRCRLASSRL